MNMMRTQEILRLDEIAAYPWSNPNQVFKHVTQGLLGLRVRRRLLFSKLSLAVHIVDKRQDFISRGILLSITPRLC